MILWQNFQSESCNFKIPFRGKLLLPSYNFLISWFILRARKTHHLPVAFLLPPPRRCFVGKLLEINTVWVCGTAEGHKPCPVCSTSVLLSPQPRRYIVGETFPFAKWKSRLIITEGHATGKKKRPWRTFSMFHECNEAFKKDKTLLCLPETLMHIHPQGIPWCTCSTCWYQGSGCIWNRILR